MYLWAPKPKQLWHCTEEGGKRILKFYRVQQAIALDRKCHFTILLSPFSFKYKIVA